MKIYLKKFLSGQVTLIFALACFAFSPQAYALCQEGCLTDQNTALGESALTGLTTGSGNTAIGDSALSENTNGDNNTATGNVALAVNSTGHSNTGNGESALRNNQTGNYNTATGKKGCLGYIRNRFDYYKHRILSVFPGSILQPVSHQLIKFSSWSFV